MNHLPEFLPSLLALAAALTLGAPSHAQLVGLSPREKAAPAVSAQAALTRGKSQVTVRFEAKDGGTAGGVSDLRVVRL